MTQAEPVQPVTTVIRPEDAAAYLEQMDIRVADVAAAIEAGDIAAGDIGDHHPITGAGLTRWIQVVGALRERLASGRNWRGDNPRNRPISRHTGKSYTLSTVGGTDATGILDHPTGPLAARKKGRATAEAVTGTLTLIAVDKLLPGARTFDASTTPPSGNWFLVYYRDDEEIRTEISLPLGFSDGQFTGWRVRVILDSWKPAKPVKRPLDVGGQDVDFEVREVG
ncbi:hypothetical protein ACJH6J_22055 [Mycobacterium sp. SMC-18]|uniref:hypothetical protein n=1 Tax=Mycobacterium sp. SMC-18 TaxID=3381629 RepID=UPI0038763D3D